MPGFKPSFYEKLFTSMDNSAVLNRLFPDGSYTPIWCSREFARMMEGEPEEYLRLGNRGVIESIHPDDREDVAYLFRTRATRDGTNNLIIRKSTLRGTEIWVKVHYAFVEEDGVTYAYCTYTDVTDIKQNEEQTKAVYQSMVDQFNALADESLAVQRTNLTTGRIEESRGIDLYDTDYAGGSIVESARVRSESFLVPGDREKYEETFQLDKLLERTGSGQGPATFIGYCRRQSGRQCFVKFSGSASRNPVTGDVIAFGVETEANSEMVSEVMDQKILAWQFDMVTYLVSDYYGVVIGDAANIGKGSVFPKERNGVYMDYITSQVIPALAPEEDRDALLEALSPATVAARLAQQESYVVDAAVSIDGELFHKRFTFYTVDADMDFYILLKSDITDVIREQARRNTLLADALHEAERANAAKTAFLSSMSHEIRTPMNAIIGLDAIALKDPDLPPSTREYLEKINGNAKHLLGLINDILDISRIESGRMILHHEEFSFREMLEQINTMIHGQCQDRGLSYECRLLSPVDDYYIGDAMKLKQVLLNILGNAVKFTPAPGSVKFTVERTARFENQSTLRFTIADTGIGMDKDYLPHLFDPFSQEDDSKTNRYGSTGLGMAITKNIVEMMNGTLTVESEKGAGSTFVVSVTLRESPRVEAEQSPDLPAPHEMRVLVIDDDPVACQHASLVLEEAGIESDLAQDGDQGLEMIRLAAARHQAYDLILVDLHMPGRDGVQVTRAIREQGGEAAIIILTAYSWDDVLEEALAAGVDGFMAKPLFVSGVLREFRSALQRRCADKDREKAPVSLAGRRILLAEDMDINAEIMVELLSMEDMTADRAENGQIALEKFAASAPGTYAAILMDVRMPVMDGLQATQAIRALDRPDAKTVPIIAMTANAFDEDVQQSLQVGMNAHLTKPVEPQRLFGTLQSLMAP